MIRGVTYEAEKEYEEHEKGKAAHVSSSGSGNIPISSPFS